MRKLSTVVLAIAVIAVVTVGTNAQIKNVLLEQHTGAWCGWCPDGTVVLDEILDLYGDQVIGVKIHTGDDMKIPEQSVIAGTLGLSGVPSASIDRKAFGGSVFLNRGSWKSSCEFQMQQRAKAEVDCFYTLDRNARMVRIRVVANIAESMDFPLRFNAHIVEDDVTGTGSGYDQKNYLSARPGYEDNPYYDQPATIVGYHHMKVVRTMLGGPWGVAGDLPASVKAGELHVHEFEAGIDRRWNIDNLHFIGLLQADAEDNKEIINSAIAVEDGSLRNRIIDSNTPAAQALPAGSDVVNGYTLENLTDEEQTYTVTLSTTDRTPADWSAEFISGDTELAASGVDPAIDQIVVPASSTAEFALTLKMGPTLGLGDAKVILELEGTPSIKRSRIVSGISSEIERLLLETGSEFSMRPYLSDTVCADAVTLNPSDYLAFADKLPNVSLIIWNKGPADGLAPEETEAIKSAENVNTFICGDGVIGSLVSSGDLGFFGLDYIGWNLEAEGPMYTVWLSGQEGDVITGNVGSNIEGQLMYYYVNMVSISDPQNVFPIMHFRSDGWRQRGDLVDYVFAGDAIFGVRSTRNNNRTVLLGISPYIITRERTRQTLVSNILDWLGQDVDTEGPQ